MQGLQEPCKEGCVHVATAECRKPPSTGLMKIQQASDANVAFYPSSKTPTYLVCECISRLVVFSAFIVLSLLDSKLQPLSKNLLHFFFLSNSIGLLSFGGRATFASSDSPKS